MSVELQKIELKKIADAMKVNRLESTALINTIQRLKKDMALPANSRAIGSLMFQSADAKKKLDELNLAHDLLFSKQTALTTPPSDSGGNDDSGDGKIKPLVDIDSGSGPTQSEKDKVKRDQEAAAQYIQTLQNQFLTAGQLETNRYKVETQKLAEAFALKTAITQEEQQKQNILKEDLESQHLAKKRRLFHLIIQ